MALVHIFVNATQPELEKIVMRTRIGC